MKEIPVFRHGAVAAHALVSDEDFEWLSAYRWTLSGGGYAKSDTGRGEQRTIVWMHRAVLGLAKGDPLECDHINRIPLDNQRENLRAVTHAQNQQNKGSTPGSTSRYRGVCFFTRTQQWYAQAKLNGRIFCLGYFDDEEEAADAAADFRARHMPFSFEALPAAEWQAGLAEREAS